MRTVDSALRILAEVSVAYEGINFSVYLVVHTEDDRVIVNVGFVQLIAFHGTKLEETLRKFDILTDSRVEFDFLDVVFFIGGVHHLRHIVHILLFCHACVNSEEAFDFSIHFERQSYLLVTGNLLSDSLITDRVLTVLIESLCK